MRYEKITRCDGKNVDRNESHNGEFEEILERARTNTWDGFSTGAIDIVLHLAPDGAECWHEGECQALPLTEPLLLRILLERGASSSIALNQLIPRTRDKGGTAEDRIAQIKSRLRDHAGEWLKREITSRATNITDAFCD